MLLNNNFNDYTWLAKAEIQDDQTWLITKGAGTVAFKKTDEHVASLYELKTQMRPGFIFGSVGLLWLRCEDEVRFLLSRDMTDKALLPGLWQLPSTPVRVAETPSDAALRAVREQYDAVGAEWDEILLNAGDMRIGMNSNGRIQRISGRIMRIDSFVLMVYAMDLQVENLADVEVRNRQPELKRETRLFTKQQLEALGEKGLLAPYVASILQVLKTD